MYLKCIKWEGVYMMIKFGWIIIKKLLLKWWLLLNNIIKDI